MSQRIGRMRVPSGPSSPLARSRDPEIQRLRQQVSDGQDNSCLYVFGLARDEPVIKGNAVVRPHRIGTSVKPSQVARQGSQWCWWPTGIVECFWTLGPEVAKRLDRETRLALNALDSVRDGDETHGAWWNVPRAELILTVRVVARRLGLQVWDAEQQAARLKASKAALLRLRTAAARRG